MGVIVIGLISLYCEFTVIHTLRILVNNSDSCNLLFSAEQTSIVTVKSVIDHPNDSTMDTMFLLFQYLIGFELLQGVDYQLSLTVRNTDGCF